MAKFMTKFEGEAYAALRIIAGLMFVLHGSTKLFSFPEAAPTQMPIPMLYVAGGIEFVAGAMIAVGFQTRWAAFLSAGLMAAAYWMVHGLNHLLPHINKGELAVLYCFIFLYIAAKGPGKWSLDVGTRASSSAA